ncbi:hypothetical protein GCM10009628_21340 [Paeniglutamicibacter kerguelensis]
MRVDLADHRARVEHGLEDPVPAGNTLVQDRELWSHCIGDAAGGVIGVKEHKCSHGYKITGAPGPAAETGTGRAGISRLDLALKVRW